MTRRPLSAGGFSLTEVLVTLIVMAVVVVGALTFFDLSARLARTEVQVAGIQSTQRVAQHELARMAAMAGVGGLPEGVAPAAAQAAGIGAAGVFPNGLAVAVANNVAAGTDLGGGGGPLPVVAGTDVLTLRGVFTTPVYHLEPQVPLALGPGTGEMTVDLRADVDVGVTQDLDPLRRALATNPARPEALVVYDRYNPDAFAVLELAAGISAFGSPGDPSMTIGLSLGSGATYGDEYGQMALGTTLLPGSAGQAWTLPGGVTVQLPKEIGAIGLLEEYRFFVRQEREVPGLAASRLAPVLARARFYPGTGVLHPEGALDLADNVIDLQVALAVDQAPVDGQILDVGLAADDDEILYNFPGDDDGLGAIGASIWAQPDSRLLFLRISTVVQGDRPDPAFVGAVIDVVEDHDYTAAASIFNTGNYTKIRKRLLQTVAETRNLP